MKINGIIAEYNPFHNGHKYQLENAKKATGADYTIIVMSGNFVQRGAPALVNKYKRTEMALHSGADLVLELPMYYATSSAEYFATGAVSLLDKLHVADYLCFGSESGDVNILREIAEILVNEPEGYTSALRRNIRQGTSYPTARSQALIEYNPAFAKHYDLFSSPNNILGIEYQKALLRRRSTIKPYTTLRKGAGYNDTRISTLQDKGINDKSSCPEILCSALAIRQAIFSNVNQNIFVNNQDTDGSFAPNIVALQNHMPESAYAILTECMSEHALLQTDDFSAVLHYKLLSEQEIGYEKYLDVSPELSDRIRNNLYHFESFTAFCDLLKTKDMTYTRISRCLLHILLDITSETMDTYRAMDYIPYARVLGFRKDATPLLSAIKERSSLPLVTKLADAEQILSPNACNMLERDIRMNAVYESIMAQKAKKPMLNEYRTPLVIV